jgi:hypothetical protein
VSPLGFLVRALFCFLVVFATWNPTGVSYLDWLHTTWSDRASSGNAHVPELTVVGTALFAVNLFLARTAWLSLRPRGMLAIGVILLFAGLAAQEAGLLTLWRADLAPYLPLLFVWVVLTAGLVRSIIRRRVLGQSDGLNPPP